MINSFNEITFYEFESNWFNQIKQEIEDRGKEYILGVDENEFIEYLCNKYQLTPLAIESDSESVNQSSKSKEWFKDPKWREKFQRDVYTFTVGYKFTGTPVLFSVQPNPWTMSSFKIQVNERDHTVSFKFKLYQQDVEEFKKEKRECYRRAFVNMAKLNENIVNINKVLLQTVTNYLRVEKNKHLKENDFFSAINVKINKNTESIFTAPTLKKKTIPQPKISKDKEFTSEPSMGRQMYNDILKVIYDSGKNMEKNPLFIKIRMKKGFVINFYLF